MSKISKGTSLSYANSVFRGNMTPLELSKALEAYSENLRGYIIELENEIARVKKATEKTKQENKALEKENERLHREIKRKDKEILDLLSKGNIKWPDMFPPKLPIERPNDPWWRKGH